MIKKITRNLRYAFPIKKFGYIGWLGKSNMGDEFVFQAIQKMLHPIAVLPYKLTGKIKDYEKFTHQKIYNGILLGGGTLINGNVYLGQVRDALDRYKNVYVFGTGVRDPDFWQENYRDSGVQKEWIDVLKRCRYISVRGPRSKYLLEKAGINNVTVVGDPALFFADKKIIKRKKTNRIGINFGNTNGNLWGGNDAHVEQIIYNLIEELLQKNYEVVLFPVCIEDSICCDRMAERFTNQIVVFKGYLDRYKVLKFMRSCDVFIGEKLHSVVMSVCAFTPVIMFEYRPKCRDFMESLLLEKFLIRTDQISLEKITEMIKEIYSNYWSIQKKMEGCINNYRACHIQMKQKLCVV